MSKDPLQSLFIGVRPPEQIPVERFVHERGGTILRHTDGTDGDDLWSGGGLRHRAEDI